MVPRQPVWQSFVEVLTNRQLLRLNFGVFALHMMLTAMWVLLPLILATHGGGTGLPTQRECLEILGCTERGSVGKLAEIVAGTVLAGEISLASAISSLDWVSSHEQFGRNR